MFPFLKKDEPVKIRFMFDTEQIKKRFTTFDSITMERYRNGERSTERFVILMSHFLVDQNNQPIPEEKAIRTIERLNMEDFEKAILEFVAAFNELTVPKASGSDSSST